MDIVYEETLYSKSIPEFSKHTQLKPITMKPTRNGIFEVYKDKAGEYRFRLKAPNGEIIAVGEGYKAKKSCMNGIQSIKKSVLKPKIVELK